MNIVENFRESTELRRADGSIVTAFVTVVSVPRFPGPVPGAGPNEIVVKNRVGRSQFTVGQRVPGREVAR